MKCDKCGFLLLDGDNFCRNCGKTIIYKPVEQVENTVNNNDDKKANKLCIYSLLLYFAAPIIFLVIDILIALILQNSNIIGFSGLSVLARIAGFVLMIVARIKYPNNMFAKVLMWVYIALIAAGFVFGIIIVLFIILSLLSL